MLCDRQKSDVTETVSTRLGQPVERRCICVAALYFHGKQGSGTGLIVDEVFTFKHSLMILKCVTPSRVCVCVCVNMTVGYDTASSRN